MAQNSGVAKATAKEIEDGLALIARGESLPGGFAYNGEFDPPIWRVIGPPSSEHMHPPKGVESISQEPPPNTNTTP